MASSEPYSDFSIEEEFSLPLPFEWGRTTGPSGNAIYIDKEGRVHHEHPIIKRARLSAARQPLPSGWIVHEAIMSDGTTEDYYTNAVHGISMWDHPLMREEIKLAVLEEEERQAEANAAGDNGDVPPPPPPPPKSPLFNKTLKRDSNRDSNRFTQEPAMRMTPQKPRPSMSNYFSVPEEQMPSSPRKGHESHQTLSATTPVPMSKKRVQTPYAHRAANPHDFHSTPVKEESSAHPEQPTFNLHEQRLAKDVMNVMLMNCHRLTEVRKRTKDLCYFRSPSSHAPACYDVPENDIFAKLICLLQRTPTVLAATLAKLYADGRWGDSARLCFIFVNVLLGTHNIDERLITSFLTSVMDTAQEEQHPLSIFTGAMTWDSSMSPLCASSSGTIVTQTLLCHGLRSDIVSYLSSILLKKINPKKSTTPATAAWDRKRTLKQKERGTILTIVQSMIDGLCSREALIKVPMSVVTVAAELEKRLGSVASAAYILNLFILPSLPLLLLSPGAQHTLPMTYTEFSHIPTSCISWWNSFTEAVSPRQAQFVSAMTPDEFEASFECPSWAGIMWCFWRVMQAAMDGGKTGHGEDIDIAAAKNARKVEGYKMHLISLASQNATPVLDPLAFTARMANMSPLPVEAMSHCVTSSEDLAFVCPALHDFLSNSADELGDAVDPHLFDVAKEASERCHVLMSNAVYICQLPVTEANKHGKDDLSSFSKAPVAPPPPPLPTRSHGLLSAREDKSSLIDRSEKREVELKRGMERCLEIKEELERMKRMEVFTPVMFEKKVNVVQSSQNGGFNLSNNRPHPVTAQKPESVIADVDGRVMRLRNLQEYDDSLTHYEQKMKFMGELRRYDPIPQNRYVKVRGQANITRSHVNDRENFLKPRLDPNKLRELEQSVKMSEKKDAKDHFFLMGRDENNEPSKLVEFDSKMMTMRSGGFSPHKQKHGFKPKPWTPAKEDAEEPGFGDMDSAAATLTASATNKAETATATATAKTTTTKSKKSKKKKKKKGAAAEEETQDTELEERRRKIEESAKKVLAANRPGADIVEGEQFDNQIAALLSVLEMGKQSDEV
ncbi:hypothetical protein TrST_g8471 [Triparma strigata]|uniref:WW domain-containing protein n=1 Tax=Triparma strigata TaxID=1606541 RepID=A0A9W7EXM6_9STRA|nr:hypothetical protein TrST_g8471 [Triparma strigata]